EVGLKPTTNGGTVELFPAAPADTATLFQQESVDGTATQEPWGYILESQADADLILNWDEFAWGKDSTNTVVAATNAFKENAAHTASLFQQELVDGSATQEAVCYILESQADADVILNWDESAWAKDSTNTVVAATNAFKENEAHSKAYLDAHVTAVDFIKENP